MVRLGVVGNPPAAAMSSLQCLRELIRDRLTAAAEEIFRDLESTIDVYEEELEDQRKLLEDQRKLLEDQRKLLEDQRKPHVAATSSRGDLRSLIGDRLNAAAAEILRASEKTVFVYEEALERHRSMLDLVYNPRVKLHRIDLPQQPDCEEKVLPDQESSSSLESTHIKEGLKETSIRPEEKPRLLSHSCPEGEQRQFEGVPEEFPPEQPERSIRVKQEEEGEAGDIIAVTVKREEDEVHLSGFELSLKEENREDERVAEAAGTSEGQLGPDHQQQQQVKTPKQEETGSCDFKVKEEADVVAVKSEGNEEGAEFSQLHQRVTEDREDCGGPGLARTSGPYGHLGPRTEDKTHSSETEDSDDWTTPLASTSLKTIKTNETVDCKERGNTCDKISSSEHSETGTCKSSLKQVSTEFGQLFDCSKCGKKFKRTCSLTKHKKIQTGEKPFSCLECDKRYKEKSELRQKEIVHTGEKSFSCSQCGKRFARKSNLSRHERMHSGEKPFSCSQCGKRFTQKHNLRLHEAIHTGKKPFCCPECGKRFASKRGLVEHKQMHTGERPLSCSQCGKTFGRKFYLTTHEQSHSGEKPFSCSQCGKRFGRKDTLRKHELIHSREKPFSCSQCGKRFKQINNLKTHEIIHTVRNPSVVLNVIKDLHTKRI